MPLGSSSAAPVTIPGPSALRNPASRESQDDLDSGDAARGAPMLTAFFAILATHYKYSEKVF